MKARDSKSNGLSKQDEQVTWEKLLIACCDETDSSSACEVQEEAIKAVENAKFKAMLLRL
jgi:hypothetical protein